MTEPGASAVTWEAQLRARGLKLTPQRRAILCYLDGNGSHPTAAEVFAAVTRDFPMASRATVYNTLSLLVEIGAVRSVPGLPGGDTRFDPKVSHHHHVMCPRCGAIADLDAAHVQVTVGGVAPQLRGLTAHVRFEQTCATCASPTSR
ncbi:MAG: transcriptional repressor [Deltaproteobacteria bacterium]|nr:transcriptional repressor [Deltaproteobacteria bacterium]